MSWINGAMVLDEPDELRAVADLLSVEMKCWFLSPNLEKVDRIKVEQEPRFL